jgi:predicted ester cyclase
VLEGKIVESWVEVDMLGVMQQLGAVPEPEQS